MAKSWWNRTRLYWMYTFFIGVIGCKVFINCFLGRLLTNSQRSLFFLPSMVFPTLYRLSCHFLCGAETFLWCNVFVCRSTVVISKCHLSCWVECMLPWSGRSCDCWSGFWSWAVVHLQTRWMNALAPLSGQALVTGRLWATANNFTGFGNITLKDEMLHNLVSNQSVWVFPGCGEVSVGHLAFKGFNFHVLCGTKVVCKCGYMVHPIALEIRGFLCREVLQI